MLVSWIPHNFKDCGGYFNFNSTSDCYVLDVNATALMPISLSLFSEWLCQNRMLNLKCLAVFERAQCTATMNVYTSDCNLIKRIKTDKWRISSPLWQHVGIIWKLIKYNLRIWQCVHEIMGCIANVEILQVQCNAAEVSRWKNDKSLTIDVCSGANYVYFSFNIVIARFWYLSLTTLVIRFLITS